MSNWDGAGTEQNVQMNAYQQSAPGVQQMLAPSGIWSSFWNNGYRNIEAGLNEDSRSLSHCLCRFQGNT